MPAASAFIPETIKPPKQPLSRYQHIRALIRNPIELWSEPLFDEPARLVEWMGHRVLQIADPELVKQVLLDEADKFQKSSLQLRVLRPLMGNGILTAEGERWRVQRRSAAPAFRPAALTALVPTMADAGEAAAQRLANRAATKMLIDVAPEMAHTTLDIIAKTLLSADDLGLRYDRLAKMVDDYLRTVGKVDLLDVLGAPAWMPRPWMAKGQRAAENLKASATAAIERRRQRPELGHDLLGLLLAARDPETGLPLTDDELRDNVVTFIGAGHETTALALTWTLYLIANDPAAQDRLVAEADAVCGKGPVRPENAEQLQYHLMVVREAMRLYPPVAATQRRAVQDVKIGDALLRQGDLVVILIYVMHRHRRLWTSPQAFDPERFGPRAMPHHRFAYLPFGAGPRICIGAKFAELEAVTILANLIRALRFSPNAAHRIIPKMRITTRPEGGMPLFVERRSPAIVSPVARNRECPA